MFNERKVSVHDQKLNLAVGPANGPPLLLLHGVTRRWQDFAPLVPSLTAMWKVFALDHRGHGRSSWTESYLVTDYSRDAVDLILSEFEEPVVLFGHSLGAMAACAAAAELPEQVRAIILEDPPFDTLGDGISETPFYALFSGMRDQRNLADGSKSLLANALAEIRVPSMDRQETLRLGDVRDAAQLRFAAKCLVDLDPSIFLPLLDGAWLTGFNWRAMLPKVKCPALLMAADCQTGGMMPEELADTVEMLLKECSRVDFKNAGHQIHWQQTDAVARTVSAFLESL